ncbi:hypothetical protein A2714_03755 [Candidatus Woesebacteria bacterium RIFCSPHIGHO2_01_FULL_38_9]|uniref:DUF4012 domain-containing protein n=2 Tax=Candidatus Woeseibacteriota TaxID=1752722 RepID=A0A1F7Y0G7_9BACT|nr:MAG: hypothetical protein A2714_03755 [Candidatus Woesebacteria bacterium RIFCSPHIGHO2_01_FULL_38_9]OGM59146.1 MAG: hypothetical protein A3A75_02920 [Candidatus Woesebacteria bacterium RIFCSPLOWO2_01_FULL_39_10]
MATGKDSFSRNNPKVLVISEFNLLSKEVVFRLIEKNCTPIIIAHGVGEWNKKFADVNNVEIISCGSSLESIYKYNSAYTICLLLSSTLHNPHKKLVQHDLEKIRLAESVATKTESKTVFVLPYSTKLKTHEGQFNLANQIINNDKLNVAGVFLGELIPQTFDRDLYALLQEFFQEAVGRQIITVVTKSHLFYPLSIEKAAPHLLRYLFSLKAFGKKIAILGKKVSSKELELYFRKINPYYSITFSSEKGLVFQPEVDEKIYVYEKKKTLLSKAYQNAFRAQENILIQKPTPPLYSRLEKKDYTGKVKNEAPLADASGIFSSRFVGAKSSEAKNSSHSFLRIRSGFSAKADKKSIEVQKSLTKTPFFLQKISFIHVFNFENIKRQKKLLAFFIFLLFLAPAIFISVSILFILLTKLTLPMGYLTTSSRQLKVSSFFSNAASNYSQLMNKIPLVGGLYKKVGETSTVVTKEVDIGVETISLMENFLKLTGGVLGGEPSEGVEYSETIYLELENIYRELGFLGGELQSSSALTKIVSNWIVGDLDIKILRDKSLKLSNVFKEASGVLGKESPKKYALLFQNNNQARGSGGTIENFGIFTFENLKMTNLRVYDTGLADSKLVGQIDPPSPLRKYFDASTWYLQDASWDPDFPTTASQVEWFLDKELDERIDGVVSVDGTFVGDIISSLGGIQIEGDEEEVNYEFLTRLKDNKTNLSQDTEFFSTAILRGLLNTRNVDKRNKIKILKIILKGLENKNVQVFVKDQNTQKAVSSLGWDGALTQSSCFENCFSDFVALIESVKEGSSLGVKREAELEVSLEENLVKRKIILFLDNDSDINYLTYLRLITTFDSGFEPVEIVSRETEKKDLESKGVRGFKEVGVFVEIPAREVKAVIFKWESGSTHTYKQGGEYKLLWRKQSGIAEYPIKIRISHPHELIFSSKEPFTLTDGDSFEYNTTLSQDKFLNLTW